LDRSDILNGSTIIEQGELARELPYRRERREGWMEGSNGRYKR
jgi:hypothetical protein